MAQIQRIIKVGDSIAAVIPKKLARALGFQRGDLVKVECIEEGVITIRKITDRDLNNARLDTIT